MPSELRLPPPLSVPFLATMTQDSPSRPTPSDIESARARISDVARVTPVRRSAWLTEAAGVPVWLKLESEQVTGSFKVRGAANTLLQLSPAERKAGVVAVSSGNHGRAVAHVAALLGIGATICLSGRVPTAKRRAIEELGARVVVAGPDQDDADSAARRLVSDEGLVFVHPFDDPRVISGQGTVGAEIVEQVPDVRRILVPLSGGGLAGGIAVALSAVGGEVDVIGVSQDRGPAMIESIAAGRIVPVVEEDTLADALAGGLGESNAHSFDLCRTLLSGTALVSEEEIGSAMAGLARHEGLRVEGGGAVGPAAILKAETAPHGPIVIVISGGNVSDETFAQVLAAHR